MSSTRGAQTVQCASVTSSSPGCRMMVRRPRDLQERVIVRALVPVAERASELGATRSRRGGAMRVQHLGGRRVGREGSVSVGPRPLTAPPARWAAPVARAARRMQGTQSAAPYAPLTMISTTRFPICHTRRAMPPLAGVNPGLSLLSIHSSPLHFRCFDSAVRSRIVIAMRIRHLARPMGVSRANFQLLVAADHAVAKLAHLRRLLRLRRELETFAHYPRCAAVSQYFTSEIGSDTRSFRWPARSRSEAEAVAVASPSPEPAAAVAGAVAVARSCRSRRRRLQPSPSPEP